MTATLPAAPAHPDPAPVPAPRHLLGEFYDAFDRVHRLAGRGAFTGHASMDDLVVKVWPGWRIASRGLIQDGCARAFVLCKDDSWVAFWIPQDGPGPGRGQGWAGLSAEDRATRFRVGVRQAVGGGSFEVMFEQLVARVQGRTGADAPVAADLLALSLPADHGHAQGPLRFLLRLRNVLPQVDTARRRVAREQ